jgi:hypothetical protein
MVGAAMMVNVYDGLSVSNVSSAVIVKLNGLPAAVVGVPVIVAVVVVPLATRDRPGGNDPPVTLHVQHVGATSVAVKVWLYATLTSPCGRAPDPGKTLTCARATPAHTSIAATARTHLIDKRVM